MNWIRQTFGHFGWFSSNDKQPLKDDFHRNSIEAYSDADLSTAASESATTIKTFAKQYPVSKSNVSRDVVGTPDEKSGTTLTSLLREDNSCIASQTDITSQTGDKLLNDVKIHEDTIDLLESSTYEPEPEEVASSTKEKKKHKRTKKVRKRVTWAVRRSWKWLKRGWAGYAPGVASGLMYCSNAPKTLFNIYSPAKS